MTDPIWIDIETRSQCDLVVYGLMNYATDPTTEVICVSWAVGAADVQTWFADSGEPFPAELIQHRGIFYAHNAQFERLLFDFVIGPDYDFRPPALEQWRCSAARAMAHGLPGALADVCRALDLPLQKQTEGKRLLNVYSLPGFATEWQGNDRALMQDYCEMDVLTMRQFCGCLRELSDSEWAQYHATERMNDRGAPIQLEFATAALKYSEEVKGDVDAQIKKLTGGKVETARARKARDEWILPLLSEDEVKLITVKRGEKTKISFDKEHQAYLKASPTLHPGAARFLDLLEEAGGAAVSKYKAMTNLNCEGRVYSALVWNGAGATGRYSSRGLQLQNFRRDTPKDPEPLIDLVMNGEALERPADVLGSLTRAAITCPDGLTFSDYSQIEARVLPWLADDIEAEKTLDVFRQGRDLYTENAVGMFTLNSAEECTPDLRQSAKVAVLACGFGGGANALLSMARIYGLTLSHDKAKENVFRWRSANPWAMPLWYGLKEAAHAAVRQPGSVTSYGRIKFSYDGADWLWMLLPSGRFLAYCQPRFELVDYPWGDSGVELTCLWGSGKPKAGQRWPRRVLNHLILSENATQAVAADVMRETIQRADADGLPILFSVHDELIVEGECFDQLHAIMETPPPWADGLPIAADTQYSTRYGK